MLKTIEKLLKLRGPSGFEFEITNEIIKEFSPYADEVFKDSFGNIYALKKGKGDKNLLIEAHYDEIALIVTKVLDNGFLKFSTLGGVDVRNLKAKTVTVLGKTEVLGVIGAKPPHLLTSEEQKKATDIKDMFIDTGLLGDEAKSKIRVGDPIVINSSFKKLLGDFISGKCLDDRAGVAVLLKLLKSLSKKQLDFNLYVVLNVQEELGLRGAKVSTYRVKPDKAISIDVCHAVTNDNSKNAFTSGEGVVISTGPNIDKNLFDALILSAKKDNIPYAVDADGGDTGTDAWEIQVSYYGVPTGLLSIPLKYMHTSCETLSLSDLEATHDLLLSYINGGVFNA